MLRSVLIAIAALLAAAAPAAGADPMPATSPSAPPSAASSATPTADELTTDGFDVFAESPITTVSLGLYSGLP
ncbi:MAG: hypothetical protein R6W93_01390, partial [Candidatus Limnocylindrales bacterium]